MLWKNLSDERWTQDSDGIDVRDAVHALAEASELLRASSDAMLDPQAVLEAVTGPSGDVVDFVFRDANKACCDYIGRSRAKLLERSMLSVFPNVFTSGLMTHFTRCAMDGVPVVLDDFQYIDEVTGEDHHFDIRAAQVRTGMITLLVRDVGERFASMRLVELARESERQADARFRRLMATSGVGTCLATPDGRIDIVNQALCDFFGYDSGMLGTKTWQDVTLADSLDDDVRNIADLLSGRVDSYRVTRQFIHADGRPLWGDLSVSCLRDADGTVEYFVAQIVDITAEVQSRQELEEARHLLRASADSMLDPQVLFQAVRDADGRVTDFRIVNANVATGRYLQTSHEKLVGRHATRVFLNMAAVGLLDRYAQCLEDGEPVIVSDFSYVDDRMAEARRYDIRATRAGHDLISLTWSDTTERYEAARRLAASEEQYRLLAMNSSDVIVHTRDGVVVWVSPSVEGVLGAPPEFWLGRNARDAVAADDRSEFGRLWARVVAGESVQGRVRMNSVDGVAHWVHLRAAPFYDADGRRDGGTASLRLIDAEVAAEAKVRDAQLARARADALYRRSVDSAAVGMCLADLDGRLTDVNAALCRFLGYDAETLHTKTWQELSAPDHLQADLEERDRILAGEIESYRIVKRFIHADGRLLWGDLSVSCVRDADGRVETFIKQIIDVTETIEANERIAALNQRLTNELQSAAKYIASIMPSGLAGEASVTSRFLPSRELGGDCFDYYWIDDDHLIVYLIDVSGHGIEPALLAVSVQNVLRSGTIPNETLRDPAAVLTELNRLFQMEQQGDHFFTVWYGVYDRATHTLRYASAGAPPAYAFTTEDSCAATELVTRSEPVGAFQETRYAGAEFPVPPGCRILIYSDGASEIALSTGGQLPHEEFRALITRLAASPDWTLDELIDQLRALTEQGVFHDDMSLIRLAFD